MIILIGLAIAVLAAAMAGVGIVMLVIERGKALL